MKKLIFALLLTSSAAQAVPLTTCTLLDPSTDKPTFQHLTIFWTQPLALGDIHLYAPGLSQWTYGVKFQTVRNETRIGSVKKTRAEWPEAILTFKTTVLEGEGPRGSDRFIHNYEINFHPNTRLAQVFKLSCKDIHEN